jgi:hypothetical protein
VPKQGAIPKNNNPDGLTMEEILKKYGIDSIPIGENKTPDFSGVSVFDVGINMKDFNIDKVLSGNISEKTFSGKLRDMNYNNADKGLLSKLGMTKADLQNALGYELTWHEDFSMKKCFLVPTDIHANLSHMGSVNNYKVNFNMIPSISNLVETKVSQFAFRIGMSSLISAPLGIEER